MEHIEPICCFDSSMYTGLPDTEPCPESLNIPEIISELDAFFSRGREKEAGSFLEKKCALAAQIGDWRGELSLLSELMGYYRRSGEKEKGIRAVNEGLKIIREHRLGRTVSGATIMLNAATTMKCFGSAEASLPVFIHVSRVFSDNLAPEDYRFPGLYNNLALSYGDIGEYNKAEKYFKLAMALLSKKEKTENDMAASLCNLAELYDKQNPEDERIGSCMEKAWDYLNAPGLEHDGYHAFTVSKCLPTFEYFGYFLWTKILRERVEEIYDRP